MNNILYTGTKPFVIGNVLKIQKILDNNIFSINDLLMETAHSPHLFILIIGILISASLWIKAFFNLRKIAPLVGFILLGFFLRFISDKFQIIPEGTAETIHLLGEIGVIIILFTAGLECHVNRLVAQLSQSSYLAIFNVIFSGVLSFIVSYYILSLSLVVCLFIAIAMTATSIGVTISLWSDIGAEKSEEGELLVSMAAIDDIIGILLMALLFEVAPLIYQESGGAEVGALLGTALISFSIKFLIFVTLCIAFSLYLEPLLMKLLNIYESEVDRMITVLSHGFIIASVAAVFGFSGALGAFFAGVAMSHDKEAVLMEQSFKTFGEFFGPFFFISIGYQISTSVFSTDFFWVSGVLIVVGFVGKYLGSLIPMMTRKCGFFMASLLGLSMIPRAEIALVVMERGKALGEWAVSEEVYSSMVVVTLFTCLFAPLLIYPMLEKSGLKRG